MGETPTTRTSGGSTTSPAWREAPAGRTRLLEVGRTGRAGTVVRRAQPPPPRIRRPRVVYERLARRWRARFAGNLFSCFLCFRAVSCTWARCRSCCNTARAIMTCSRRSRRRPGASRWDRGTPRAWRGPRRGERRRGWRVGGRSIVRAGVVPSRVHARARRARGRGVAHRALRRGQRDRRGRGMPPARRRRAQGIGRPPRDVFALRPARRRRRRRRGNRTRRRTVRSRGLFRRIHRVVLDVPRAGRDGRGETPGEEYPVRGPG